MRTPTAIPRPALRTTTAHAARDFARRSGPSPGKQPVAVLADGLAGPADRGRSLAGAGRVAGGQGAEYPNVVPRRARLPDRAHRGGPRRSANSVYLAGRP